jgi:hypothetical protein
MALFTYQLLQRNKRGCRLAVSRADGHVLLPDTSGLVILLDNVYIEDFAVPPVINSYVAVGDMRGSSIIEFE